MDYIGGRSFENNFEMNMTSKQPTKEKTASHFLNVLLKA